MLANLCRMAVYFQHLAPIGYEYTKYRIICDKCHPYQSRLLTSIKPVLNTRTLSSCHGTAASYRCLHGSSSRSIVNCPLPGVLCYKLSPFLWVASKLSVPIVAQRRNMEASESSNTADRRIKRTLCSVSTSSSLLLANSSLFFSHIDIMVEYFPLLYTRMCMRVCEHVLLPQDRSFSFTHGKVGGK